MVTTPMYMIEKAGAFNPVDFEDDSHYAFHRFCAFVLDEMHTIVHFI